MAFEVSAGSRASGKTTFTTGRFALSGGATVNLSGSGHSASIRGSGGSRALLDSVALQEVSVNLSGGSEARVNARSIASADLTDASRLIYLDDPLIGTVRTSNGATISRE